MQMTEREYVEGSEPAIYIGRRIFRRKDGSKGRSKSFHAEYTLDSKQHSKSLGTANKAVAIRNAHGLCQRLVEGTELKPLRRVTVTEMKDAYLEMLTNRGRTEKTMVKYRYVLKEFTKWWQDRGDRKACTFIERDFWSYRKWLEEQKKSLQTISDRLILVKQLFKWGAGKGKVIPTNAIADATVPEPPPMPQPCFTPDQVQQLLAKATPAQRPIFAVMAYLGLRVGEVVALRWQDVLFDRGETGFVHVRLGGSNGTTKGKQARLIPIHPELKPILQALPRIASTVFTRPPSKRTPQVGLPLHDRHLLVCIKRLCRECGFPDAEQYKLHTFRHAFASMCARSQISAKYALNWMGHKNSDILDMYITMYDTAAESAIRTINYNGSNPAAPKPAD